MALQPSDSLFNGQYRIVRLLGRGGFGFVYLAEDTLLREEVAIKELIPALVGDEGMLKRFLSEAKATMRLRHERIVCTHNVFSERGNYYIIMEYMPGGTLETRLQGQGALPMDEAAHIAADVAEGLAYAHERGVVHCDLKPANVLFAADGHAKVADFGIAHIPAEMFSRSWNTPVGFAVGTLPYMSPEQADGVRNEPRIDVYALGAVLYRMLTGRPYLDFDPREAPTPQAENIREIHNQIPIPPSVHNHRIQPWLDQIVLKALAKRPEERFASAGQLRDMLMGRGQITVLMPPSKISPTNIKSPPLPPWFWPVIGSAVVLLGVVIVLLAWGRGKEPPLTVTPAARPQATVAGAPIFTATHPVPTPSFTPAPASLTVTATPSATAERISPTYTAIVPRTPAVIPTSTPTLTVPPTRDQVMIPEGTYIRGSTGDDIRQVVSTLCAAYSDQWCTQSAFEDELTGDRNVYVGDFYIDRYEVTNAMYLACVNAGACNPPKSESTNPRVADYADGSRANYPVVYVTWHSADRYCRWAGGRLPTAVEWEKSARGTDGRWWPWGNVPPTTQANFRPPGRTAASETDTQRQGGDLAPVGSYPTDISPYKVMDMAGNVMEWVDTWYDSGKRELRGGSWNTNSATTRVASRVGADPGTAYFDVGFRCARSR